MASRPPRPEGNSIAARWFQWAHDEILALEEKHGPGIFLDVTTRGNLMRMYPGTGTSEQESEKFESFGFSVANNYIINTGATIHFSKSVVSTLNCRVGSMAVNELYFSLLPSVPHHQPLPSTCIVKSGFSFETTWKHGVRIAGDTMPTTIVIPAFGSFSFAVPGTLDPLPVGYLWGRQP